MPRDSAPNRSAILAAAVYTLDGVARRAGVAKGLVLYHYGSRARLLRSAGAALWLALLDLSDDAGPAG